MEVIYVYVGKAKDWKKIEPNTTTSNENVWLKKENW